MWYILLSFMLFSKDCLSMIHPKAQAIEPLLFINNDNQELLSHFSYNALKKYLYYIEEQQNRFLSLCSMMKESSLSWNDIKNSMRSIKKKRDIKIVTHDQFIDLRDFCNSFNKQALPVIDILGYENIKNITPIVEKIINDTHFSSSEIVTQEKLPLIQSPVHEIYGTTLFFIQKELEKFSIRYDIHEMAYFAERKD